MEHNGAQNTSESRTILNSDDYENIWLRVKERIWKTAYAVLGVVALLSGLGGFWVAERLLDGRIDRYVNSPDFRDRFTGDVRTKLPVLDKHLSMLEARERSLAKSISAREDRLAEVERLPVEIERNYLRWSAPNGSSFVIENGSTGDEDVVFPHPFKTKPVVMVTANLRVMDSIRRPIAARNVTSTGFSVANNIGIGVQVSWVAIGE